VKRDYLKVPARPVCTGAEQGGVCGWEAEGKNGKILPFFLWKENVGEILRDIKQIIMKECDSWHLNCLLIHEHRYALVGNGPLADTAWPKFRRDLPNTGRQ